MQDAVPHTQQAVSDARSLRVGTSGSRRCVRVGPSHQGGTHMREGRDRSSPLAAFRRFAVPLLLFLAVLVGVALGGRGVLVMVLVDVGVSVTAGVMVGVLVGVRVGGAAVIVKVKFT